MKLINIPKQAVVPPDFLGEGWSFPILPDGGRIQMSGGDENIAQAVALILGTPLGQRMMRPDFGSRLRELVFASADSATTALAEAYAKEALIKWEPRIEVNDVLAEMDGSQKNKLLITVYYTVRDTDVPGNLVYPFYLQN